MIKAYLAGYISGSKLEECVSWRKELKNEFSNIFFIDPMKGEEPDDIKKDEFEIKVGGKNAVIKDYKSVKESDIGIYNLETFGAERPLTGTLMELAWGYEFRKINLVYTTNPNYLKHPFIQECATHLTDDWNNLKKVIKYYEDYISW